MRFIKNNIIVLILMFIGILLASGVYYKRYDLTSDQRYTLSEATKNVLEKIDKPMEIDVYLEGDFPADFKQLQSETLTLLDEFKRINPNISYQLIDPVKQKISQDTLESMGMSPSALQVEKEGISTQIILFPYATIKYKGYGQTVPLITQQTGINAEEQMTKSMEGLEFGFINSIDKLSNEHFKNVGILVNQAELNKLEMFSLADRIHQNYNFFPIFPKDEQSLKIQDLPTLKKFDAIIVAKPRKAFTDEEKVVIDQYIMNGGKTLWAIDQVNAEMDTLLKSSKILAYPYDLNLTDLLFSYGIRVNSSVVKDLQRPDYINLQVGSVQGNPQNRRVPWVYFPLAFPQKLSHPITKNLNPVRFEFPSSIDTLSTPGIKKTVLYQSSPYSGVQGIPSYISLEEAKISNIDSVNVNLYNKGPQILAVLLEGEFTSAYKDRIESSQVEDFKNQSKKNKMIVISDGDVARNPIIKGQPLPLGFNISTGNMDYGNEEFLINSLNYLLDDNGLMSLRNRSVELRMLDKQTIVMDKSYWQWLNLLLPLVGIFMIGGVLIFLRRKKFR
ncbi:gliding motility-associated ABC transporter substrate-binding protein GldG [Apibacter muscae]|uniref:gliding motility-associated ABC transporter substrate-binding protein GldG n=1 Tax=Apibacter muscae TaxID=2509004 RepID=UPI0011ABE372|nr:gliding motility-associated ABC transporter substrate-binding protein GldG [Apibacter muscae]TWP24451.1 gliding motility-associated ABC transporter substrate-binding protein GldG [Apibacter muscae]